MTRKVDLRCIHRQDIQHHRSCFEKGKIKYSFVDGKEFEKLTGLPWYDYKDKDGNRAYRLGFFDIEVDNLKPDFGTVLTWAIKEREGKVITSVITKEELFNGSGEKRIVKEFVDTIKDFDIVVGYYSTRFDMPYMRAKALHYGYEFPGYVYKPNYYGSYYPRTELVHWDLYYTVRNKLGLSRNSLDNATHYLGIEGKTPIDKQTWRDAKYGDPKAISQVLDHNIADVLITEKLFERLIPFKKWDQRGA